MVNTSSENLVYAGFWLRTISHFIDETLFMSVGLLSYWFSKDFRLFEVYFFLPHMFLYLWFNVYLVQKFGGTPGKIVLGLKVRNLDGSSVSLFTAFVRYSVEFAFSVFAKLATIIVVLKLTDAEFKAIETLYKTKELEGLAPDWYTVVTTAGFLWALSEFIVLLFNRKKRAIHDFLAETVVVREEN